jgi:hypothetical protein
MVKQNSTFLTLMKWLLLSALILYIWRAIREPDSESTIEGYDDTGRHDFTKFDTPINHTIEDVVPATCQECKPCGNGNTSVSGGKLLPVMDPCFNMREVCKQCILLEDHLNSPGKDCEDCCKKHMLAIEGLCEEAVGLDKEGKYPDIHKLPGLCRNLSRKFVKGEDLKKLAQEYRAIRKPLMNKYFSSF